MKIVAFGHEKDVGKDTIRRFLTSELRLQNRGISIVAGSFADKLKKVCYEMFAWTGLKPGHYYEENPKAKADFLPALGMTVRDVWIKVGNKLREVYASVWIDALIKNQPQNLDLLVIADLRFPNEADRILEHGGFIFKVVRPSVKHTSDEADDALIGYNRWTEEVVNDQGLSELFQKAQGLIEKYFKDIKDKGKSKEDSLNLKTPNPGITTDPNDPGLHQVRPDGQNKKYLVIPESPNQSRVRPLRYSYKHLACGGSTRMNEAIAESYAKNPNFYTHTMCVHCKAHFALFNDTEKKNHNFVWEEDGTPVGS